MSGHTGGPYIRSFNGKATWTISRKDGGDYIGSAQRQQDAALFEAAPAMKGRLELTAGVIEELYREGAFRRLETGSDREREALALLLTIVSAHTAAIAMAEGK